MSRDLINKKHQLKFIKSELKASLDLFCAANNPYVSLNQSLEMHYPFLGYLLPTAKSNKTQHYSYYKPSVEKSNSQQRLKRKKQSSLNNYSKIKLQCSKIKVRRKPCTFTFNSKFSRYQLLQFFKTPTKKTPSNSQKSNIQKPKEKPKIVICDVFSPLQRQSQGQFDQIKQKTEESSNDLGLGNESSNICGWSSKSAEKLFNFPFQAKPTSQNSIAGKLLMDEKIAQIKMESQLNESEESIKAVQYQQDYQSSKIFFPFYSIVVISPSQNSVCQSPISLILNSQAKVCNQPSIKCMSSSKDFQAQLEAQLLEKQLQMRQRHSLKKSSKKSQVNQLRKNATIDEQLQFNDQVKQIQQNEKFLTKECLAIDLQQSNATDNLESVPIISTLRSHYDSRTKLNFPLSSQNEQIPINFLTDSLKKQENQCFNSRYDPKSNSPFAIKNLKHSAEDKQNMPEHSIKKSEDSLKSKGSQKQLNQHFICEQLQINLTDFNPTAESQL